MEFARNVYHSLSSHAGNHKNKILVLGEGRTDNINDTMGWYRRTKVYY